MLKAVHLEPVPFSIDKDLITPTFKLKRPQLLKYYKVREDKLDKISINYLSSLFFTERAKNYAAGSC